MRGEQDNTIGLPTTRCCGKLLSQCTCAWEQRRKVLRQQLMGGNNGPKPQPYIPKLRKEK